MIDLRSDTVTRPTPAMLEAMFSAKVGDDVFGEDPTVIALEEKAAQIFGKEAALYCASGTMSNQIAIKVHTRPGDEVICDQTAHIYNYEGGGIAFNSGASVRLLQGDRGRYTASDVLQNINPDDVHRPVTRLVEIENTVNRGGGAYFNFNSLIEIGDVCRKHGLSYHLDGARLFNALVETDEQTSDYGKLFDSISICLSKGLGAPVGSILLGDKAFIKQARRFRKVFGGAMRQAGYLAAAGIYALDNHVTRLKEDHQRAQILGKTLEALSCVDSVMPVDTNIVIFNVAKTMEASDFVEKMRAKEILMIAIGGKQIRMVTHLDFDDAMLDVVISELKAL